jgi:serine/threonine-protein kinase RsbW
VLEQEAPVELDVALSLPRDALRRLGVIEECIEDIRLALSEAVTNVLDHAGSEDDYEVRLAVRDDICSIAIVDCGTGFDASSLASAMPDPLSPRGRGVAIMRAVLDGVRFETHRESGMVAHLTKRIDLVPDSPLDRLR